jgi:hypothetical protein
MTDDERLMQFLENNRSNHFSLVSQSSRAYIIEVDNKRIGNIYFKWLLGGWRLFLDNETEDDFLLRPPIKTPEQLEKCIIEYKKNNKLNG